MTMPGFTAEATLSRSAGAYSGSGRVPPHGAVVAQGLGCALCLLGCAACVANPQLIPFCIEPCIGCLLFWC